MKKILVNTNTQGFTLIELMISIVLGIIVTAATLTAYITTVRSNAQYLKLTQLNQELGVIMNYMVRDIKRAGYWVGADGTTANPFNNSATTNTKLGAVVGSAITYATTITYASTLTYAYHTDKTGNFDCVSDMRGFRFDTANNAVDTKLSASLATTCNINTWQNISDEKIVQINTLRFGVLGSTVKSVDIVLSGSLVDDPAVRRTLTETVRIRNDNVL